MAGMAREEKELREALHDWSNADVLDTDCRELIVTPYDGAYGRAGVVISINGSPPRGLILVNTDQGLEGAACTVFKCGRVRAPLWIKPVQFVSRSDRESWKVRRLRFAILHLLIVRGYFEGWRGEQMERAIGMIPGGWVFYHGCKNNAEFRKSRLEGK